MLNLTWVLYFVMWGVSFIFIKRAPSKAVMCIAGAISLVIVVYLCIHDLRTFLLVLLATGFAISGVVTSMMHQFNK